MVKAKVRFVGFLPNADDSVLAFDFGNGYVVKSIDIDKGIQMISELYGKTVMESQELVMHNLSNSISSRIMYYIEKTFIVNVSEENYREKLTPKVFQLSAEAQNYLVPKIRKMRLFIPGNIMLRLHYTKCYASFPMLPGIGFQDGNIVITEPYHLEKDIIPELEIFLSEVKIPFSDETLQVAFDLFELSYTTANPILSFLTCVMAIESLLNPGRSEIRNRVSRNLAILIGKDKSEVEELYKSMLALYDKRSGISHGSAIKSVNQNDVYVIRNLLRRVIIEFLKAGKKKDELLTLLNKLGFESKKPWI